MRLRKEVCLFLLAGLTLFALLAFDLHPTTGGSQIPIMSIADGTEPPPPPLPIPPLFEATPVFVADGTEPPPPPLPFPKPLLTVMAA